MINENGVVYNMNRMLRVRIQQKSIEKTVEYCPMADERLNARIEAVVKFLPAVGKKNARTGLNAKVTIYNPPQEWVSLVQAPVWTLDYKNVESYYAAKARVYVDAGYWSNDEDAKKNEEGGRSGYENIFGGYLNTSAYYRKGVDNILELYCFDISMNKMDSQEFSLVNKKYNSLKTGNTYSDVYQDNVVTTKVANRLTGGNGIMWTDFIFNVINHYAKEKRPYQTFLNGLVQTSENNMSIAFTSRTAQDKSVGSDIMLQYIKPPRNPKNPEEGAVFDGDLDSLANSGAGSNVVVNAGNLDEAMEQVCSQFPGGLRWHVDYFKPAVNGRTPYYLWQPGNTSSGNKKTPLNIGKVDKNTYKIYNFQNMLEVPSMDGSGCLNIKMMYNNQIKPNSKIALIWDPDIKFKDSISPYTQGLSTKASQALFHPSLQGGITNDIVKAIAKNNGNIFNVGFTVGYLTHHLSTHTNNWFTEIKTMSVGM